MDHERTGPRFERLKVGHVYQTQGRTLTEADLCQFNNLTWNTEPLHNNVLWVRANTNYRERIFSGTFLMAVQSGLELQLAPFGEKVRSLLGIDEIRFLGPVFPGDTVYSKVTILEKDLTPRKSAGILVVKAEILNQDHKSCAEWRRRYLYHLP